MFSHTPTAFKTETPKTNSEAALSRSLEIRLRRRWNSHEATSRLLITELANVQGRADLVEAHIRTLPNTVCLDDLAKALSSPSKAQILANLMYGRSRSRDFLEGVTGLSSRSLETHIRQLEHVGLVEVCKNSAVTLSCQLPWSMVDIVAYEVKLCNWRRALQQAIGYRSFSRSVWIVMPEARVRHARKLEKVFRAQGIGLKSIKGDGRTRIEIRCKKHRRPTSRRLYLLAVGVILRRFIEEESHSNSQFSPESVQCN